MKWKYMKKQLARIYFYSEQAFENAIKGLLENINLAEYSPKFNSLFTLKFQSFEKSRILTW